MSAVNGTHDYIHMNRVTEKPSHIAEPAPIAVVGFAGRFPGEATNARKLWDMCCQGKSAWSEVPKDRINAEAYFHPNYAKMGSFNTRGAHFLKDDVGRFDAPFFGITPNEAKAMDPQQRFFLETTYEAFENAGIPLEKIRGTQTGVYVGASSSDYATLLYKDLDNIPVYMPTGNAGNMLSNRISYFFDLKGPSISMDTACSSSLAALHIACQSLRTGESTQALVGGAHIMLSPDTMVGLSMIRLFGEEGICYTYDSRGSGYGRGEGVVSLVLKRLDHAIRNGDNIRALIRNTGANQDGRTNGITFPSAEAQANLMRSVYHSAGLDPTETDYVEAHGTGTAAGDPIEAEAIASVFTTRRTPDNPILVGSVKSNIGHLEAASGLAAIVKTIYALEEGVIAPNINFEKPNKDIPLEKWKLKVPTSVTAWPASSIRRASINNFGFGGTNIHVILEQYKPPTGVNRGEQRTPVLDSDEAKKIDDIATTHTRGFSESGRRRIFVFSANDKVALKTQMQNIASYVQQRSDIGEEEMMDRLAFTLCNRRSLLEWREAISASKTWELSNALASTDVNPTRPSGNTKIGFVFTGQGAQWPAMGRELLYYTIFEETLQQADRILLGFGAKWSLLDELSKDKTSSLIDRAYVSQPASTAVQIALVRLFSSWGITPSAVLGHSSGEIAAAYAAGALSLEQCMLVAYHRGMLAQSLAQRRPERPGGMLAIGAPPAKIRPMIERLGSANLVIACINAPSHVTISGNMDAISELQTKAEEECLFNRRLKVDVAYHSRHMRDIAGEYLAAIKAVKPNASCAVQFHSSVKGGQADTEELTATYWVENLTSPVLFVDGLQSMYDHRKGPDILIEIGPHSALKSPVRDIMKNSGISNDVRYFPSLVRSRDASLTALSLASALHVRGCNLDFSAINNPRASTHPKLLEDLPSYPWNHSTRHWHESRLSVNHRLRPFPRSDLLGSLVDNFNENEPTWRNIIRITDIPWLSDHKVQGSIVFPATGYLVMALEAMSQYGALHHIPLTSATQFVLQEVKISRPLVLSEDASPEVTLVLRPREEGSRNFSKSWMDFAISSWTSEKGWAEHCQGLISVHQDDQEPNPICGERQVAAQRIQHKNLIENIQSICQTSVKPANLYFKFLRAGLEFGPAFRNVVDGRAGQDHAVSTISIPNTSERMPKDFESRPLIHPATFDAFLQVTQIASSGGDFSGSSDLYVPTFFREIAVRHGLVNTPGAKLRVLATRHRPFSYFDSDVHASFLVLDAKDEDKILVQGRGFVASRLPNQSTDGTLTGERGLCYQVHLEPCIDLMTPEQYAVTFSKVSDESNTTRQTFDLERATFYHLQSALEVISKHHIDIPEAHLRELHRVVCKLVIQVQEGRWPFQTSDWLSSSDEERKQFLNQLSASDDCSRLVCSIGENLVSIFKGEVDPLSIMLRDNMLGTFYRDLESLKLANQYCANMIAKLAHQNPSMRIIEIGAGTGSDTMPVLRALGLKFAHYDFTDISPGFFERAKEEQKDWSHRISYCRLNIEEDPVAQGFQAESYDLVIAVNVLHAKINMENTMRNVRRLLRTGGKVLVSEVIVQLLATTMTFGTLPGWWLAEEAERADSPLLTEKSWDTVYSRSGFSGLDGSVQVHAKGVSIASVMLTTAITEQKSSYPEVNLIVPNEPHTHLVDAIRPLFENLSGKVTPVGKFLEVDLNNKFGIVLAMGEPLLSTFDEIGFKRMQVLFSTARGILWVSQGAKVQNPEANMFTGVARCLRTEFAGLRLVTLDLDEQAGSSDEEVCDMILRVFKFSFGSDSPRFLVDSEFLEKDKLVQIPRVIGNMRKDEFIVQETRPPIPRPQPFAQKDRPLELRVGQTGQLDSIYFQDNLSLENGLRDDEVEISVKSIGMNFKDIMIALGQIPFHHKIGIECSGVVTAVGSNVTDISPGSRVCAMTQGAYASITRASQHMVAKIPDSLGFTEAASIPVAFFTAHYALADIGRLGEGESILIHAAAGGVGQAAIILAQKVKAEVFVTVGSMDKKNLIMQTYGIPENHIFSSRDTSFQQELMTMTSQKGVDVVLNSTAGDILRQSWRCLAPLGRFIEIGKRDLVQNSNLEMEKFLDSVSFSAVDLAVVESSKPQLFRRILTDMIKMYEEHAIPLITPISVFPISEVQQAMRQMQTGKHMGKIVIEATGDNAVNALPAKSPKALLDSAASILITGGTGGLGRSLTRWLAGQGAGHVVLASRSGMSQKGVPELVEELKGQEVNVVVFKCDIADRSQVQKMISECKATLPPIKGVIHGAMALQDVLFEKISLSDWNLNIKPRVQGAWNLHHCLADVKLDFFLMLASSSGQVGNAGQTAYAASNTFLDAFASYRRNLGLPACAIDIGIVEDVGYVFENTQREKDVLASAQDILTEAEFLTLVKADITGEFIGNHDEQTLTGFRLWPDRPLPTFASDPKFLHVLASVQSGLTARVEDEEGIAVQHRLKQADSLELAIELVCEALLQKISNLLTVRTEDMDRKKAVVAYGLDSLVAVELRNWITVDLDANVPLLELMSSPSIENLAGNIATKSRLVNHSLFAEGKDDGGKN